MCFSISIRHIFLFFLMLFVCSASNKVMGQEKLDAFFNHLFDSKKMMGSVAIWSRDSLYYANSIGYADVHKKAKNDQDTKFRIGSITKTYTAVLILKAVEEKKLNLNTYLSAFYPQIKNAEKITIEQFSQ